MLMQIMTFFKEIFLVLLIILIKRMELMIFNGISYKSYRIQRLNSFYGVLVVVFNNHLLFMLIQKLLNKRMIGLQHQMLILFIHNHNISILLSIQVPNLLLKNLSKMLMLGQMVLVVLLYVVDLEWHLRSIIEIQDYLNKVFINHFLNNQKLCKLYLPISKIDKLMFKRKL